MTAWTSDELDRLGAADEIEIAPLRPDGRPRPPVTIWIVRVGDDLYVRSYRGHDGAWFRAAQASHAAHIRGGGVEKPVTLVEENDPGINDQVDAAYRAKYGHSIYVGDMVASGARATTMRAVPRSDE